MHVLSSHENWPFLEQTSFNTSNKMSVFYKLIDRYRIKENIDKCKKTRIKIIVKVSHGIVNKRMPF